MKKSGLGLAVVVFLLTAWSGITWVVGNKAEAYYRNMLQKSSQFGFVTFTNKSYDRGFLQSKAVTLMQIEFPAMPERDCPDEDGTADPAGHADAAPTGRTVEIEFTHLIHHGPLPTSSGPASRYGFSPAIALIETTLTRFSPDQEGLDNLLQEIPGLRQSISVSRIALDGTTDSQLEIPAFTCLFDDGKINAGGLKAATTYVPASGAMSGTFDMQSIALDTQDGGVMNWQGLSGAFDLEKALPMLYVGASKVGVGAMEITFPVSADYSFKAVTMKTMEMTSNSSFDGRNVEYQQSLSFGGVMVDGETYGPLLIDAATRNLDARALSDFQQQVMDVYRQASDLDPDALAGTVLPMYVDLFGKLVAGDPEFAIRKFSLATPYGAAEGTFNLKIADIERLDFTDPGLLPGYLQNIDAAADLSADEGLVRTIMVANTRNSINEQVTAVRSLGQAFDMTEEQIEEEAQQQSAQQIEMLIAQKFVMRDGAKLKSRISFRQGALMVNGQVIPLSQ